MTEEITAERQRLIDALVDARTAVRAIDASLADAGAFEDTDDAGTIWEVGSGIRDLEDAIIDGLIRLDAFDPFGNG